MLRYVVFVCCVMTHGLCLVRRSYGGFSSRLKPYQSSHTTTLYSNSVNSVTVQLDEPNIVYNSSFFFNIDKQIANIAVPAFVSLVADPLASMVDALYIGIDSLATHH